ncbi:unnamed protein product [Penicillium roqueforti FM164]|uniref:Genomic scaffold, ProqFM164S02 n=2 Tax=Penicillium roqueforti TaxID=5082 RepID=W6Q557_PENRF|nr:unnamed protein product [Penicillium roqueforti FM164]
MFFQRSSLLAFISLHLGFIPRTAGQVQANCLSQQILNNDLNNCICAGGNNECQKQCPVGPVAPVMPAPNCGSHLLGHLHLDDCEHHCLTESNDFCKSCWIWNLPLCLCLQNGGCLQSSKNAPYWVKITSTLATTNLAIPDILNLQENHKLLAGYGWDFGQETASDPKTESLVINSAYSITENQIHMHVCNINTKMRDWLATLYQSSPSAYQTLVEIPPPYPAGEKMFCRASQTADQTIPGDSISDDINSVIQQQPVCKYFVGAAVIRDSKHYTWVCVTADHLSAEYGRFCA